MFFVTYYHWLGKTFVIFMKGLYGKEIFCMDKEKTYAAVFR